MHITQETDYAIRIVYCLANARGRKDARSISEEMGVTLRFSLKILHKLVQNGIVKSYKGSKGGYELARPAAEINMKQVIETVNGLTELAIHFRTAISFNSVLHLHFCSVSKKLNSCSAFE